MVQISLGKGFQKSFFLPESGLPWWQTRFDSTYVEMQKALHGLFDTGWFIGPWHQLQMSAARAPGGLRCKWIVSIKWHSAAGTKWIACSLWSLGFFFQPITSHWVIVFKCLKASLPRQKKAWAERWKLLCISVWLTGSDRYNRNTEGTKLGEICPGSTVESCQSAPHFQNEVGRGHCLARYNYTVKLILSARHNGR